MRVSDEVLGAVGRNSDSDLGGGRAVAPASRFDATFTAGAVAEMWGVVLDHSAPRRGHHSYVFHAHDHGGQPRAIKVVPKLVGVESEVAALTEWGGHGAVQVFDHSLAHGALLLEWLDPTPALNLLRARDAAAVIGELAALQARHTSRPFRSSGRYAADLMGRIERRNPDARTPWSDADMIEFRGIAAILATPQRDLLAHADMHPRNVLRRDSGVWAAIDPAPYVGDPELALAKVFWTHRWPRKPGPAPVREMLDAACAPGNFDRTRAAQWAVLASASAALYWQERGGPGRVRSARAAVRALMSPARA